MISLFLLFCCFGGWFFDRSFVNKIEMTDFTTDKEAFEALFRQHYPYMLRLARTLLHDKEESRDAVSDVLLKVCDGSIRLPAEPGPYLLLCVRNRCLDVIRRCTVAERVRRLYPLTMDLTAEQPMAETDRLARIQQVAECHFTSQTLRVFTLRYDDRKSYQEIAAQLGISKAAVYKHLAQAMDILHRHLDHNDNE
jgi:RNA polymerase sigma-70 factor (ECF subfamily)